MSEFIADEICPHCNRVQQDAEIKRLKNQIASKSLKEYRYDKIANSVSEMGGWANFENFVNKIRKEICSDIKKLKENAEKCRTCNADHCNNCPVFEELSK